MHEPTTSPLPRPAKRFASVLTPALACCIAGLSFLATSQQTDAHHEHRTASAFVLQTGDIPDGAAQPRKGVRIVMPMKDDPAQRAVGKVLWFDLEQIAYVDKDDAEHQVAWADLAPDRLGRFLAQLPDRKSADSLLMTAELMVTYDVGKAEIERLLGYALRADEDATDRVEAVREKLEQRDNGQSEAEATATEGEGDEGEAGGANQPQQSDNPRAWPELSDEQNAEIVKRLIGSTNEILNRMGHKMGQTETERFIVYSDMPKKDSQYWVSVLDKMYDKLCETFDLDKEKNIWNGKCLLMFFNSREDYQRYNAAAYGNNAAGSAGICWQFGNGDVHIAMWKQQQKKELAHTLVHEAVHGFLFRYQSSYHIPNWLNEGLAEYISVKLVDAPRYPGRALDARSFVKREGGLGNFLTAPNIIGPHYGLAYDVTDLMIGENRKGYVKMIQGIKRGLTVEYSFEEEYGASLQRVFEYYGKSRLKMDLRI